MEQEKKKFIDLFRKLPYKKQMEFCYMILGAAFVAEGMK